MPLERPTSFISEVNSTLYGIPNAINSQSLAVFSSRRCRWTFPIPSLILKNLFPRYDSVLALLLLTRARYCRHRSRLDATKRLHHNTQRIHEQKFLVNSCEASIPHLIAVLHIAPSRWGVSLLSALARPRTASNFCLCSANLFFSFFFLLLQKGVGGDWWNGKVFIFFSV